MTEPAAYTGPERRTEMATVCDNYLHRIVQDKIDACKGTINDDIHGLREDMSSAGKKIDALAADVHRLNISVADIAINSKSIAASLQSMTEVREAYDMFKAGGKFLKWLRENIVSIAILVAIVLFLMGKVDLKAFVGWIL
jgi:hypothetical protein